ncbi:hypothetical protein A8B75_10150 [Sphingomonadales bacterium EhC05]|nr:hypothetical protein A8B75_10150 [Sphingomonadales bacterium EhC05]
MRIYIQLLLLGLLVASAFVAPRALAVETNEVEEQSKKPKKIKDRRHPDYVRCRSEPIIGSLSRKRRVCMTNTEWAEFTKRGSRDSRQFVDDNQPGFMEP